MIFDDIRAIMSADTARKISRRTGIDKNKVHRMANGQPFLLDYDTYQGLFKMGYEIKIVSKK